MAKKRQQAEEVQTLDPSRLMLAYLCVATEKEASLEKKLDILDRFGLTDVEISKVCGSKMQSIWNARHEKKRR
jgi:hypothetical protein